MNHRKPSHRKTFGPGQMLAAMAGFFLLASSALATPPAVTTQMYDNHHSSWNPNETQLTINNVKSGGLKLLFKDTTDDGTYAQPLYIPGLNLGAQGTHNVIFVATENNTVYAFDADTPGAALWSKNLTPPGETLQLSSDYANNRIPHIGITGTPVIDASTNTLYVIAASKTIASPVVYHQRLHALNVIDGSERANSPVDIAAKYPGTGSPSDGQGNVVFNPLVEFNRAALTLFGNTVYTAWSAHEDNGVAAAGNITGTGAYQGWVIAYDKTSLQQVAVYNDAPSITPDPNLGSGGGSIWQASVGMVADDASIYALTANGPFNANTPGGKNYGDSLLRLTQAPSISVADYFTPCDQQELYYCDVDLGAGAPMILPDQSSGPSKLITFAGKEGSIFLINRGSMGQYTPTQNPSPADSTCPKNVASPIRSTTQCSDNVVQVMWRVLGAASKNDPTHGADRDAFWGAPAYFADSSGRQYVYYTGDYSPIIEYDLANGTLTPGKNPSNQANQTPSSTYNFAHGGTLPSISSNHGDTTTAIVWAIQRPTPAPSPAPNNHGTGTLMLDAYPANDLTTKIVNDIPAGQWTYQNDAFLIPTVVNGKVYVSSSGEVDVFGVGAASSPTPTPTPGASTTPTPTPGASPTPTPTPPVATATPTPVPTSTPVLPGALRVNRIRMNFGRVRVGITRNGRFRVANPGKGPLNVMIGSLSSPFTVPAAGPMMLPRKKVSRPIIVQFTPTSVGPAPEQTLTITSDDPNRPSETITIEGSGR